MHAEARNERRERGGGVDSDGQPLSIANLKDHNATEQDDHGFAYAQLRQESARHFERSLIGYDPVNSAPNDLEAYMQDLPMYASLVDEQSKRARSLYQTSSSSAKPTYRHAFMSPQNEPTTLIAAETMRALKIPEGTSWSAAQPRIEAARVVVAAVDVPERTTSTMASASDASPQSTQSDAASSCGPSSESLLAQQGTQFDEPPGTAPSSSSVDPTTSSSLFGPSSAVVLSQQPRLEADDNLSGEPPALDILMVASRGVPRSGLRRVNRNQAMRRSASRVPDNGVRKRRNCS